MKKMHLLLLGAITAVAGVTFCPNTIKAAGTFNVTDGHLRDYYYNRMVTEGKQNDTDWIATNTDVAVPNDNGDDTEGIQAAIDACNRAGGGTVKMKAGTYRIGASIIMRGGVTLDATGATIVRTDISEAMVRNYIGTDSNDGNLKNMKYNNSGTTEGNQAFDSVGIVIKGGTWDGGVTAKNSTNQDLFRLYCLTDLQISDATLKNVCGDHHIDLANVNGATIKNVKFSGHYQDTDQKQYSSYWKEGEEITSTNDDTASSVTSEAIQFDFDKNFGSSAVPKNITVTGCTFKNCISGIGSHHNDVSKSKNITITNNTFTGTKSACVNLYTVTGATVTGNTATNVRSFVRVYKGSDIDLTGNKITTWEGTDADTGVTENKFNMFRIDRPASITISGNNITGAGNSAIKVDGAATGTHPTATINGNTIVKVPEHAISLKYATGYISKNTITSPAKIGIYLENCTAVSGVANSYIRSNTIKSAGTDAISLKGSAVSDIGKNASTGNTITSPKGSAIYVTTNAVALKVIGNTINTPGCSTQGSAGICLKKATKKVTVEGNTISKPKKAGAKNNGGWGIVADGKSKVAISGNTITNPKLSGIYVNGGTVYGINNNKISGVSKDNGIYVKNATFAKSGSYTGTVNSNTIKMNYAKDGYGIKLASNKVSGISNITVSKNKITGKMKYGIRIQETSCKNTISKNTVTVSGSKKFTGIKVEDKNAKYNFTIKSNTITGNKTFDGIRVEKGKATINSNTVKKCNRAIAIAYNKWKVTLQNNKLSGNKVNKIVDTNGGVRMDPLPKKDIVDGKITVKKAS